MTDTPFEDYLHNFVLLGNEKSLLRKYNDLVFLVADLIINSHSQKKITAFCGNGGSASDAQHWSAELMCRYELPNRPPLRAIALTTDTSFITACTNDFNFSSIFSRQISAFDPCLGLIIGLSTSGKSSNVLNALSTASDLSIPTVLLTGLSGTSHSYIDHFISFPSSNTALVQTYTQVFYHSVCSLVDQHFLDHA